MKRYILISVIFVIITLVSLILVQVFRRYVQLNMVIKLPEAKGMQLNGILYNTACEYNNAKPLVIIYYHPECDVCKLEIIELLKYQIEMKSIQLLFVSFASIEDIKKYMQLYPIDLFENVIIVSDIYGEFANKFDIESSPMIFIYDANKVLIKRHKGSMTFKKLEKYLK